MDTREWFAERLKLRLMDSPWGPSPAPIDEELEPLAGAVDAAAQRDPGREDLETFIRERKPWYDTGLTVEPIEGDMCRITVPWRNNENIVPRALLLEAIGALRELRARERLPAPWLFRPDPLLGTAVEPEERELVSSIDFGDVEALEAFGLLSAEHREHKRRLLERWGLPVDVYDAALEAQAYLASEERREEMPWAASVSLKEAPVSLDLFRAGLFPPPGVSRFAWAAVGEHLLEEDEDVDAAVEGSVMLHDAGGWLVVLWKRAPAGQRQVRAISLRATPV